MKNISILLIFFFFLPIPHQPILAQNNSENPYYIVQSGETLSIIAQKFNVTVDEIVTINNISNPDLISPGIRLIIPGLQGISGELTTHTVEIGERVSVFSKKYLIPTSLLTQVNRLTSPNEVYAGSDLIISINQAKTDRIAGFKLQADQSLFESAILLDKDPWSLVIDNEDGTYAQFLPNDIIYLSSDNVHSEISAISPLLKAISISPLPLFQGMTETIRIETTNPISLSGKLNDQELFFFTDAQNQYYSLQGLYAMADPGLALLSINGTSSENISFSFQQMLLLKPTLFKTDPPINVSDQTIDPAITKPEEDYVKSIIGVITPQKLWTGKFVYPLDEPVCYKSIFGNRRSYNGGALTSFHTGLDFGVCAPSLNIYAAAAGRVVFAGPLTVRGNVVFIDHGQGIFSGYFHQSQIKVKTGDLVQAHQLIGLVGSTGRVTGPHLHFEIWVNGVQVNPSDWFQNTYPQ